MRSPCVVRAAAGSRLKTMCRRPIKKSMNHVENSRICASEQETLRRLKQFASIALISALISIVVLGALIHYLSIEESSSYTEVIKAHWLSRAHLAMALWVAGLFLLSLVSLLTGLIAIYSSFRVAGPLYRFAHNLSISDSHSIIGIRKDDCLQDVSRQLLDSIQRLDNHKQAVRELGDRLQATLQTEGEDCAGEYAALVKQLKARIAGVRIS